MKWRDERDNVNLKVNNQNPEINGIALECVE